MMDSSQADVLRDCAHILAQYIAYGQNMRAIGRGFSATGLMGHADTVVLEQALAILRAVDEAKTAAKAMPTPRW